MTKYYSLKVSRAQDVAWDASFRRLFEPNPSLYVETELGGATQKTNTIKEVIAPVWEETLPLICNATSMHVSIKLKHRSKVRDKTIGCAEVALGELLDECNGGETEIRILPVDGRRNPEPTAIIIVHLTPSDSKSVAELALQNLVRDMPQASLSASRSGEILSKADSLATDGKEVIQSDLARAVIDAIPVIDNFVATMDKIADANPYLKVAWYATSALYKIVSDQVKADDRFKNLVIVMVKMFRYLKDVDHLHYILQSFEDAISETLGAITECCLLMRSHVRHSFAGRSLSTSDKTKIDNLANTLDNLGKEFNDGFVRQIAKTSENIARNVDVLKLFQSLDLSPKEETNAFDRPRCLPGTRTAIQQQIIDWVSSESSSNIFWLNGVAGSGKSTVATSIADHYRKESKLGAYLFFTRDKSRPSSVIPNLAYRLATAYPSLAAHLSSVFAQPKDMSSASAGSLFEELIKNPLSECESEVQGPIVIILDALDECGTPSSRRSLMLLLQNEFSKLPSKFRFLITSRPESDIWKAFSSRHDVETFELDSSSTDSQIDVHTFLSQELPKVITDQVPPGWKWDTIVKVLSSAAAGLFIWASTLVKLVSEATFQFEYLENLVSNSKSFSLQDLYSVALKNAFTWDEVTTSRFSKIMALILFGNTQLSDETIDGILGLAPSAGSANILSRLRSLIAYESGKPIRLHHASFYDYLTSSSRINDSEHPWFFDIDSQKRLIAGRCFDVMETSLRFNICNLETAFVRNMDVADIDERIKKNIPQHLIYACRYWAQHLCDVPFSDDLLKQLSNFAYENLLRWLEVLSLTENFYHQAGQALQAGIGWIRDNEPELSKFLRQAINLANTFAVPMAESAPHIYASMITLTEKDSAVSGHYSRKLSFLSRVVVERKGIKPISGLLKRFKGHTNAVNSVGLSPDGKHVVSGSDDKTVLVWDVETGAVVAGPFKGHTDGVTSVGFSPDGKRVVSGSYDKTVLVWDVETGAVVAGPFKGHTDRVTSVGFSPDGKRVVSGSYDKTILVWDVETGAVVAGPFKGHTDRVTSVGFSPDGKRVVSGSYDKTVLVWDVETGAVVAGPFKGHTRGVTLVGFSPDGKRVVSGSYDNTALVWDIETGAVVAGPFKGHTNEVTSVGFSPDGKRVVSRDPLSKVLVWDMENEQPINGPSDGLSSAFTSDTLSQDGKHKVIGFGAGCIRVSTVGTADGHAQSSDEFSTWTLSEDSWIRSQGGKLLLWIPPDLRPTLWLPNDISVFNCQFLTRLDFRNYSLEQKWYTSTDASKNIV